VDEPLREKNILKRLSVNMGNLPLITQDFDRRGQTMKVDLSASSRLWLAKDPKVDECGNGGDCFPQSRRFFQQIGFAHFPPRLFGREC
jgi:hypothetical protein